ncbi:MAG: zinc ribbon domain-containing protein [Staphylococcus sp.]|nr:zinc ribbon domain-containing protein [Staphylococcus sp.]
MVENLNCPNCGAPLDTENANGNVILCPYCGNKLMLSGATASKSIKKEGDDENDGDIEFQYYEPRVSTEEFEKVCQDLFDNNPLLPDDIFHEVNFQELKRVFLPTWVFRGNCKGSINWTRDDKPHQCGINEYFEFRTLANRSDVVPADLAEQLEAFKLSPREKSKVMFSDEFESKYLPSVNFEVDFTFANLNNQRRLFKNKLTRLYMDANTLTSDKGVMCNLNYTLDEDFDEVEDMELVPFYLIGFKYKGSTFYIMCDAVEGSMLVYRLPEDEQRKKMLDSLDMSMRTAYILMAIWFIPPILWIFGPLRFSTLLWLLIPAFILTATIAIVSNHRTEEKRKQIIEEALNARKK